MTLQPRQIAEIQEAVRAHEAIAVRGGGTKGPPSIASGEPGFRHAVDLPLTALCGITEYTPDECVFTALAGTPLTEINEALAAHGQYLPFDPPLAEAGATIGGTVAAGLSGSCRYRYGGVRDFLIGVRFVDGDGTLIRSGGKVVKNAAGFLLHHAMVGSAGRLGVIAEVTFKVFPRPEARATLQVSCANGERAQQMVRAIESARFDLEAVDFDHTGTAWIRVAGRAESLPARIARLRAAVGNDAVVLEGEDDDRLWARAREFRWCAPDHSLIKIAGPVTAAWTTLASAATASRFACAGAVAYVASRDPDALSDRLAAARLPGVVIRGAAAGRRVGLATRNEFEERVRRVLDPHNRFSAAPHPAH